MSEEQARALAIATIHQNLDTGMWFVRGSGNGLVREVWLESPLYAERIISSLVANGYEVEDPEHYCDLFDLFDEPVSQYEDSRDAAEAPTGYVASFPCSYAASGVADDEAAV